VQLPHPFVETLLLQTQVLLAWLEKVKIQNNLATPKKFQMKRLHHKNEKQKQRGDKNIL
jgi:hypothetical protein